jgi:curved DNA-binding protein CbpA
VKNRRNYYRILHVQPDAPLEIIKSSYRTLLLKLKKHPDLGGDHEGSALLNEAKEVLFDQGKRSNYDREFLQTHTLSSRSRSSGASEHITPSGKAGLRPLFSEEAVFSHVCRFCNKLEQHSVPLMPGSRCSRCRSPLYPTRETKKSRISNRAFQRITKHFVITYYTEWPPLQEYYGQTTQLSPTGMQFCADEYLQPGRIIKIHSRLVEAVAKVIYCFYGCVPRNKPVPGNMAGVEFLAFISRMEPGTFVSQTT